jgi:hypothetical protein
MKTFKHKGEIAKWLFIHNIGALARQYSLLTQSTERAALVMENFGRKAHDIEQARAMR